MTRFVQRLAVAGVVTALVAGVPAMSVAQAAHQAARTGAATLRPRLLTGVRHSPYGMRARPAFAGQALRPAGAVQGTLQDVAALSPASAWAVGFRCVPGCGSVSATDDTLIQHWNGQAWSTVPSPNPGRGFDYLYSVSAASAKDAWAVGYDSLPVNPNTDIGGTLILHWNGKTWSKVPSPSPSTQFNELDGVSAVSATSAWAVGFDQTSAGYDRALILRWNGKAWSRVPSPGLNSLSIGLSAVRAVSATSAWAFGAYFDAAGVTEHTLILHWNGKIWSKVPSPSPRSALSAILGASVVSATSAWAVGGYCVSACFQQTEVDHTLVLHWNGRTWSRVASPNPGMLGAASAVSATSAWAVGGYCVSACGQGSEIDHSVIAHWNGRAWSRVASPNPYMTSLLGTGAASAASAWAVGYSGRRLLILDWNGKTWSAR